MAEKYLDKNGNPIEEGWYRSEGARGHLFFIEEVDGKFIASTHYRSGICVSPNPLSDPKVPLYINPKRLFQTTPKTDKQEAQEILDFIRTKQSRLEQLVLQSEKTDDHMGHDDDPTIL
ncbi:MAG: hypothetical protein Q8N55_02045 [bacterium]|nr:hypothetical protein [bacterium]